MNKILVFLAILVVSEGAQNFFGKCKRNDVELEKCMKDNLVKGWSEFAKAYKLDNIPIEVHETIPNLFEGWLSKAYLEGFENIEFHNIFMDFNKRTFDAIYAQPRVSIVGGEYKLLGGFLGLKIDDTGSLNATYTNGIYKYHFDYDIEKRDGEEYIKITNYKLTYDAEKLHVDMDSSKNPEQGKQIQNLFNNFWQILNILSQNVVGKVFSDGYTPIIQEFFSKNSLNSLFD